MFNALKSGLSEFTEELSKDALKAGTIAMQKLEEAEQMIEGGDVDEGGEDDGVEMDEEQINALIEEKDKEIEFWKKSFEALQQQEEEEHGSDEAKHLKQMLREKTEEVDTLKLRVTELEKSSGASAEGNQDAIIAGLRRQLQEAHDASMSIHTADLELIKRLQTALESEAGAEKSD